MFSVNCWIVQHQGSENPFFTVLRLCVKQTAVIVLLLLCVIPFIVRTEIPKLYPLSILPMYHPINTYFSSVETYSIDGNEALYVMRRSVVFTDIASQTIKMAQTNCEASTYGSDEYHCEVVSCAVTKSKSLGSAFLSPSEKDAFCGRGNANDYLYILARRKIYPCAR